MCRSTDNYGFYYPTQRDQLKIRSFQLRFKLITNNNKSRPSNKQPLPETLTLHYLPRLSGSPLEIDSSKIRPDTDAFVTLHRVRSAEKNSRNEAVFVSRERVRVGEAVQFEVFIGEEKVLKGAFRKDEEEDEWRLDCTCALEREAGKCFGFGDISEVEVSVAAEGEAAEVIEEVVDMRRRRRCRRKRGGFVMGLEEIPEEREHVFIQLDGCDCCCDDHDDHDDESGSDGEDCLNFDEKKVEEDQGDLGWAVDVGFWVVCLGVGYLVSRASTKRRRRMVF